MGELAPEGPDMLQAQTNSKIHAASVPPLKTNNAPIYAARQLLEGFGMSRMPEIEAHTCRAPYGGVIATVRSESGDYFRQPRRLTDAQSQGTKMASTVAHGRKR